MNYGLSCDYDCLSAEVERRNKAYHCILKLCFVLIFGYFLPLQLQKLSVEACLK